MTGISKHTINGDSTHLAALDKGDSIVFHTDDIDYVVRVENGNIIFRAEQFGKQVDVKMWTRAGYVEAGL